MPAALKLNEFGSLVWGVFGWPPYQVGSSLVSKTWRDVDVRVILDDADYEAWGLGDPVHPWQNEKWIGLVRAFSALGAEMTGLPIDFQIQQQSYANEKFPGARNAVGIVPLRFAERQAT